MNTEKQLPISKHFRLQELSNGVFAAIHKKGGGAFCNAGIIDLGDKTLIFDTFFTPQAAEDLKAAAEALTGRSINTIINSHDHNDHIWGNQVFSPDTKIISTEETQRLIIATKEIGGYDDDFIAESKIKFNETLENFQSSTDEKERGQLSLWVDYYQSIFDAKPILDIRVPDICFKERQTFSGTTRSAELIAFSGGHTESDSILYLPQDGIVFMGDLLDVGHHPWLVDGDPKNFIKSLETVTALDPKQLVPGHGPVGKTDNLTILKEYIQTMMGIAKKMVEDGDSEKNISSIPMPEAYTDWLFSSFFTDNLHYLYQSLTEV